MSKNLTPVLIFLALGIAVTGQFMLKTAMTGIGRVDSVGRMLSKDFLVSLATTWQVPVALGFYALGAFLWMVVLSREDLSYAYPFMGLTFILVLLVGRYGLGETVGWTRWLGTGLVALGVWFVTAR